MVRKIIPNKENSSGGDGKKPQIVVRELKQQLAVNAAGAAAWLTRVTIVVQYSRSKLMHYSRQSVTQD